jgi:hypothetical protein
MRTRMKLIVATATTIVAVHPRPIGTGINSRR